MSKVSSLTLCIYYTTKVVLNQEILLTFFKKIKDFFLLNSFILYLFYN
nr:MAG TPA: hypothetical protein [Caudoviricetes sp.]DAN77264.1 MAG TPA: hypothetical protein [Caudoviricetes sp.]DAO79321.1 MAG TPA: hypothetical protein [Caudoviricetes sp.]DAP14374.1 MAG TPA: hypothetical protein [Caudoviricetes sp.]DAT98943.1 MAG TPA: hypothetical protein [Caudoviricetes sp.]